MEINFEQLKRAKGKDKTAVFGYVRKCQYSLPQNSSYYNIPQLIYFICYAFYTKTEYFTKYGKHIKLNDEQDTVSNIYSSASTAYGNININGNDDGNIIYLWTLKILSLSTNYPVIVIGIDSSNKMYINERFVTTSNKHLFYVFVFLDFGIGEITKKENKSVTTYICNLKIKKNDIIKMELHCFNKTLKCWVNDQIIDATINDIDFRKNNVYNMAISSYNV